MKKDVPVIIRGLNCFLPKGSVEHLLISVKEESRREFDLRSRKMVFKGKSVTNYPLYIEYDNKFISIGIGAILFIKKHNPEINFIIKDFSPIDRKTFNSEIKIPSGITSSKTYKVNGKERYYFLEVLEQCKKHNQGLISCPTGCFTGDTLVKLDGGTMSMEELALDFKTRKIWSKDFDNNDILTEIKDVFISKYTDELIELELENKKTIKCTPEHKFLLKTGEYKMAKDLLDTDEIMEWGRQIKDDLIDSNIKFLKNNMKDKEYKYHLVYKVTNKIDKNFYIGKHSTNNKEDGYLGSGKRLVNAVNKYGIDNFEKEILFETNSELEAYTLESQIVTLDFIKRPDTYNIVVGGFGFSRDYLLEKYKNDPEYKSKIIKHLKFHPEIQKERGKRAWTIRGERMKAAAIESIVKYNKSEKGREESKNRAQHMRDLLKNKSESDLILINLKRRFGSCFRNHKYYLHKEDIKNCYICKDLFYKLFEDIYKIDKNYLINKFTEEICENIKKEIN